MTIGDIRLTTTTRSGRDRQDALVVVSQNDACVHPSPHTNRSSFPSSAAFVFAINVVSRFIARNACASHDHRGYPLDADDSEWKRSSGCPRRGVSERRMRLFLVLFKPKLFSVIHRIRFCNQCHFEVYCARVMTIGDIRLTTTTRSGRDRRGVPERRMRPSLVL